MVFTSHQQPEAKTELLNFLQQKIGLSEKALLLGLRQAKHEQAPLPVVLWSFGLLDLNQFQAVLDWEKEHQ